MNKKQYNELKAKLDKLEIALNGGKGSGNFGHAGRPGERGGSAPSGVSTAYGITEGSGLSKDEEKELKKLLISDRSNYGGDVVETTKQVLKDHAWDMEGISKGILLAYEDEARSRAGIPSRDEELGGVGVSYGELAAAQGELEKIIDSKSLSELTKDIGILDMASAIQIAQDINGEKYARKMAEQMGEYSKKEDLEKFAKTFFPYRSDDIIAKAEDNVKQAWIDAADRLKDSLDFQFDNSVSNKTINGGKGSGNFGHAGRPGEVGGSSTSGGSYTPKHKKDQRIRTAIEKSIASQKKLQDEAKIVREDIETRIGQKMAEGEEYSALDAAYKARFKTFHGEDGTEYTYDKETGMITTFDSETGEEVVVTRKQSEEAYKTGDTYERASTRKANVEKIDKIIGSEKIKQTDDKKNDDANYKKLQSDISKIKKILSTEKSRENFGQEEVRKLKDKYSDYMSGNWTVTERFRRALDDFDDWASNYENNSYRPKMNRETYNTLMERIESLEKIFNGGKGSGNFGHAGREGKVGGSAPGGSGSDKSRKKAEYEAEIKEMATFRGIGNDDARMKEIARRFGKDIGEVEQDIDDYGSVPTGSGGGDRKEVASEKAESPSKVESTIDSIRPEVEKREKELSELSRKIYDTIDDTGEYIGSKQDALDYVKYNLVYGKENVPEDEFEWMSEAMIEDLEHISKMKAKKVRITEHAMSDSGYVYREVKK